MKILIKKLKKLFQCLDSNVLFKKITNILFIIKLKNYQIVYDDEETKMFIRHLCEYPDKINISIMLLYLTAKRVGEVIVLLNFIINI